MALIYDVPITRTGVESGDTERGELKVTRTIDGAVVVETLAKQFGEFDMTVEVGAVAGTYAGIACDQDTPLELEFSWIDDAGNPSRNPAVLSLTTGDTIPPSDPGALAAILVREE